MNTHQNSHIINNIIFHYSKPDLNGRIYPKEVMEKAIKEFMLKTLIKQRKEKLKKINELNGEK